MQELLKHVGHIPMGSARGLVLLDTCFIIDSLSHPDKTNQLLKIGKLALTSFNVEELMYVEHRLHHEIRKNMRLFLMHDYFKIVDIPVHPGNPDSEKDFVKSIDENLLLNVPDPSDAVLIAAAIATKSAILTKDKHHLFTTRLENFLNKYSIKVYKDLHTFTN